MGLKNRRRLYKRAEEHKTDVRKVDLHCLSFLTLAALISSKRNLNFWMLTKSLSQWHFNSRTNFGKA